MQMYIRELSSYLEASFSTGKQIDFDIEVWDIEFDIAQVIPMGVLLNEIITNAIKYAFTGKEKGNINITMQTQNE